MRALDKHAAFQIGCRLDYTRSASSCLDPAEEHVRPATCDGPSRKPPATPHIHILLLGIFPRKDVLRAKTDAANPIIAKLDGVLSDDVHLTRKGYEIWARAMNPLLAQMMEN